jgi:uncharacterized membrane protein YsdA (DUF1294 family)
MGPRRFHLLLALFLTLGGMLGLWWALGGRNTWPVWLAAWFVSINVVTFGYYGYDKARARAQGRRVPEFVLHVLAAVGGRPGAFLAMHFFRHKTVKGAFRILFWCIVVLQAGLLAWLVKTTWFG